ncbi:MAG TPA: TIGR00266 family protein [Leptospiraceae bacterium]|nr:TIGR00266 family protein [Leptospiraceae bacterium]HNF16411.1 TIGR00266 family protein [Leptospiraceae bacterium]HNF27126.1 TIGR00266 family protein [Leptospiraceae bacterium]HNI98135.1 TIGR00266 family protein [Leptospiraceae bacterium]HNM05650.1 TIGR00266 family protein [Leptospiraceae bacterium]
MLDKTKSDYNYKIQCVPDFSFLNVKIPSGKTIRVEASAMASMDTNVTMKTRFKGGFKRFLSGESLFINEFTAENGEGEINIAPGAPGDLEHVYLEDQVIYLQGSGFVASGMDVETDAKWQGFKKGFFSGQSMFLIRCSGKGDLWFNTYGGLIEIDVDGDYVVDTGYIVAFTEGLEYDVRAVGGYKSLFFSGEGLVCRFQGKGKVWIQTRQSSALASFLYPFRPIEKKTSG